MFVQPDVVVHAAQELIQEGFRRISAEATIARITAERDSSLADCAALRVQLSTMQQDLHTARLSMDETLGQGCRGCDVQAVPAGIDGTMPHGSDATEADADRTCATTCCAMQNCVCVLCRCQPLHVHKVM